MAPLSRAPLRARVAVLRAHPAGEARLSRGREEGPGREAEGGRGRARRDRQVGAAAPTPPFRANRVIGPPPPQALDAPLSTAQTRRVFDAHAGEFDAWFGKNRKVFLSELDALRAAGAEGRVLDVGVGSGVFASRLGARLGVDVSREMLLLSRRRGVPVVQADASHLPLRSGAFDTAVISFTICFADDPPAMLAEASRVLVEGGVLILGEITLDSEWGRAYAARGEEGDPFYGGARFFTLRETLSLLDEGGFRLDGAFGSVAFGPAEDQRVEKAVKVDVEDEADVRRYGFLCLRALKKRPRDPTGPA